MNYSVDNSSMLTTRSALQIKLGALKAGVSGLIVLLGGLAMLLILVLLGRAFNGRWGVWIGVFRA
jgi:hypothetical protein